MPSEDLYNLGVDPRNDSLGDMLKLAGISVGLILALYYLRKGM